PAKFPRELVMGQAVGRVRPEVGADLGLEPGVVVAGGVNDSTATVLGAGLVKKGIALDQGGTSGGLSLAWDRPLPDNGPTPWPAPAPRHRRHGVARAGAGTIRLRRVVRDLGPRAPVAHVRHGVRARRVRRGR